MAECGLELIGAEFPWRLRCGACPSSPHQSPLFTFLLGLAEGDFEGRGVFHVNDQRNMALRDGSLKVIRFQPGRGGPQAGREPGGELQPGYLMFDLAQDPGEHMDLMRGGPSDQARDMMARLDTFHDARLAESRSTLPDADAAPDPALRKHLQDHGYWHHVDAEGASAPKPGTP